MLCSLALSASSAAQTENDFNDALCHTLGGERETRHYYIYGDGQQGYVVVDCETGSHVIEGGLDKRSSLDSIQQALFFQALTGKPPAVVIYDSDGEIGRYEYRIQAVCESVGVLFLNLDMDETQDSERLTPVFGAARQ